MADRKQREHDSRRRAEEDQPGATPDVIPPSEADREEWGREDFMRDLKRVSRKSDEKPRRETE
jgi:hypothetical protein